MPALQPPSMQIGTIPVGYSTLPSVGPIRTAPFNPALPSIVQSAGFNTSVNGPVNISQTVTATKVGTFLAWFVSVSASAASALGGVPTGWTLSSSQSVATLSTGLYVFPSNPGGITTITFSSNATATNGGIACWFWEIDNVFVTGFAKTLSATGNSTSPASGSITPVNDCNLELGIVSWVLGAATLSAPTGGWTTQNAQQSSTAGATNNATMITFSQITPFSTPVAVAMGATLSAGSVWNAGVLAIPSTASGQLGIEPVGGQGNFRLDQGAGYAAGGSWGPLGGTKPGGAGSGQ